MGNGEQFFNVYLLVLNVPAGRGGPGYLNPVSFLAITIR